MSAPKRYRRLSDVPLRILRYWLRNAEAALGPESPTVKVLRRAILDRAKNTNGKEHPNIR